MVRFLTTVYCGILWRMPPSRAEDDPLPSSPDIAFDRHSLGGPPYHDVAPGHRDAQPPPELRLLAVRHCEVRGEEALRVPGREEHLVTRLQG